jgi:hypothetical protein
MSKKKPQKKKVRKEFKRSKKRNKPYKPQKAEVLPPLQGLTGSPSKNLPITIDYSMDGTNVTEISSMQNKNFAPEITTKIMKPDSVKNLLAIKKNVPEFLDKSKKYIIDICRGIDSLEAHTSMYVVLFMLQIGRILNEVYKALGDNRSKYAKWVKENFGSQHTRYFQQSRQLLAMGNLATKYSCIGKNRLLQMNRLQDNAQYKKIIAQHPYPDITQDKQGIIFKEHTDAAITLLNLKEGGIDFAEFDQSYLLSCYNKHWIEQKTVKKIKDWLDKFPASASKKEAFDDYVMNKMMFPSEVEPQVVGNLQSLNAILSSLIIFYENYIHPKQEEWISGVNKSTFDAAKLIMAKLVQVEIPVRAEDTNAKNQKAAPSTKGKKKQSLITKKKETEDDYI